VGRNLLRAGRQSFDEENLLTGMNPGRKKMSKLKLHELQGQAYEDVYMQEISNFKDAAAGVDGNDIAAALILLDEGRTDLLTQLRQGQVHVIGEIDEDSTFSELEFE
jgi:hypothetical protein